MPDDALPIESPTPPGNSGPLPGNSHIFRDSLSAPDIPTAGRVELSDFALSTLEEMIQFLRAFLRRAALQAPGPERDPAGWENAIADLQAQHRHADQVLTRIQRQLDALEEALITPEKPEDHPSGSLAAIPSQAQLDLFSDELPDISYLSDKQIAAFLPQAIALMRQRAAARARRSKVQ